MKIYKYNKGEVHTLEVRETKKMYIKDQDYQDASFNARDAFRWGRNFYKNECCITHAQAIQEAKNKLLTRIGMHTDALNKANAEMEVLAQYWTKKK